MNDLARINKQSLASTTAQRLNRLMAEQRRKDQRQKTTTYAGYDGDHLARTGDGGAVPVRVCTNGGLEIGQTVRRHGNRIDAMPRTKTKKLENPKKKKSKFLIKYCYTIQLKPALGEKNGATEVWVGGWKRKPVKVREFSSDWKVYIARVDNLGNDDFAVNLAYAAYGNKTSATAQPISQSNPLTIERYVFDPTAKTESKRIKTEFSTKEFAAAAAYGHGFWSTTVPKNSPVNEAVTFYGDTSPIPIPQGIDPWVSPVWDFGSISVRSTLKNPVKLRAKTSARELVSSEKISNLDRKTTGRVIYSGWRQLSSGTFSYTNSERWEDLIHAEVETNRLNQFLNRRTTYNKVGEPYTSKLIYSVYLRQAGGDPGLGIPDVRDEKIERTIETNNPTFDLDSAPERFGYTYPGNLADYTLTKTGKVQQPNQYRLVKVAPDASIAIGAVELNEEQKSSQPKAERRIYLTPNPPEGNQPIEAVKEPIQGVYRLQMNYASKLSPTVLEQHSFLAKFDPEERYYWTDVFHDGKYASFSFISELDKDEKEEKRPLKMTSFEALVQRRNSSVSKFSTKVCQARAGEYFEAFEEGRLSGSYFIDLIPNSFVTRFNALVHALPKTMLEDSKYESAVWRCENASFHPGR